MRKYTGTRTSKLMSVLHDLASCVLFWWYQLIQLQFASGSLVQYLSVTSSSKLPSSTTVDDVEGMLSPYLPECQWSTSISNYVSDWIILIVYYKDKTLFKTRVEEDAKSFKPLGELVYTYMRSSPSASGKGKGVMKPENLDPNSEDTILYEVYHVSVKPAL